MAQDRIAQFLGQDQSKQQDYSDFLRRLQNDPNSISEAEVTRRYRELLRNASPNAVADAYQHVLGQMAPEQRQQLAQQFQDAHDDPRSSFNGFRFSGVGQAADARTLGQLAQQAEQQDPDLFGKIFGEGSPLSGTLGKLVLAGIVAYLANRGLSQQAGQQPGPQGTSQNPGIPGGLIGAIGGLIGVLTNSQQTGQTSGQYPNVPGGQNPGLPGGLGGIIDILNQSGGQQGTGQNPTIPGGLGAILDILTKQQSGQNPGMPGDLGGILDVLSGQQPQAGTSTGTGGQTPDSSDSGPGLHVKGSQPKKQI